MQRPGELVWVNTGCVHWVQVGPAPSWCSPSLWILLFLLLVLNTPLSVQHTIKSCSGERLVQQRGLEHGTLDQAAIHGSCGEVGNLLLIIIITYLYMFKTKLAFYANLRPKGTSGTSPRGISRSWRWCTSHGIWPRTSESAIRSSSSPWRPRSCAPWGSRFSWGSTP